MDRRRSLPCTVDDRVRRSCSRSKDKSPPTAPAVAARVVSPSLLRSILRASASISLLWDSCLLGALVPVRLHRLASLLLCLLSTPPRQAQFRDKSLNNQAESHCRALTVEFSTSTRFRTSLFVSLARFPLRKPFRSLTLSISTTRPGAAAISRGIATSTRSLP